MFLFEKLQSDRNCYPIQNLKSHPILDTKKGWKRYRYIAIADIVPTYEYM